MSLFIILTILSFIMTLLYYFGFTRYLELYCRSYKKYLENYKNLNKASKDSKVIISFTTTPEHIKKIKPLLNSLLDQTVKVDQIVLNIPKDLKYDIPKEYNNILNVFECGKDYGCATKFIPTILREQNKDTIIILIQDNYIYGKDYIETMIEEYNKNKCAIINKQGILVTPEFFGMDIYKRDNCELGDDWIKNCIKVDKKEMKYSENYKML